MEENAVTNSDFSGANAHGLTPKTEARKMLTPDAIAEDCRALVLAAAGAQRPEETKEAMLARVARRLGLTFNRTRDLYLRRAKKIAAHEYLNLREKALEEARAELDRQNAAHAAACARRRWLEDRLRGPSADAGAPHGRAA